MVYTLVYAFDYLVFVFDPLVNMLDAFVYAFDAFVYAFVVLVCSVWRLGILRVTLWYMALPILVCAFVYVRFPWAPSRTSLGALGERLRIP